MNYDDLEFELLFESDNDYIFRNQDSIIVKFKSRRNGIVTSWLNGGYHEDLEAVFNHQLSQKNITKYEEGGILSYLEDLSSNLADKLDFNKDKSSGLVTSAKMINAVISRRTYRKLDVIAISTGGVNVNAGSAGDPASYYEENGEFDLNLNDSDSNSPHKPGTINSIILINAKLDESSLLLAEMTATEAKSVALRQLMVSSSYSNDIATGTGTDGIAIFSNLDSDNSLEITGKHSKLGELIAEVVIESVKKTIANQTWLTETYQSNALLRLDRYRVDMDSFYSNYLKLDENAKKDFIVSLSNIMHNPELVGYVSLILHVLDQYRYCLMTRETSRRVIDSILKNQLNKKKWINMKILVDYVVNQFL